MHEIAPSLVAPKFSEILKLESNIQNNFYEVVLQFTEKETLSPLTAVFDYAMAPEFSMNFNIPDCSVESRVKKLNNILKKTSFHQTDLSTDIRFIAVYFAVSSKKISMTTEIADLFLEYPKLDHLDEKMRIVRPTVRSMEISLINIEGEEAAKLLNTFWKRISKMSDCELMYIDFTDEEPDTKFYMKNVKRILEYYSDTFTAGDNTNAYKCSIYGVLLNEM